MAEGVGGGPGPVLVADAQVGEQIETGVRPVVGGDAQDVVQEAGVQHREEGVLQPLHRRQGRFDGLKLNVGEAERPQGPVVQPRRLDQGATAQQVTLRGLHVAAQRRNGRNRMGRQRGGGLALRGLDQDAVGGRAVQGRAQTQRQFGVVGEQADERVAQTMLAGGLEGVTVQRGGLFAFDAQRGGGFCAGRGDGERLLGVIGPVGAGPDAGRHVRRGGRGRGVDQGRAPGDPGLAGFAARPEALRHDGLADTRQGQGDLTDAEAPGRIAGRTGETAGGLDLKGRGHEARQGLQTLGIVGGRKIDRGRGGGHGAVERGGVAGGEGQGDAARGQGGVHRRACLGRAGRGEGAVGQGDHRTRRGRLDEADLRQASAGRQKDVGVPCAGRAGGVGGPGEGGIAPGVGAVRVGAFAAVHRVGHRVQLLSQGVHRILAEPPGLGLAGMAGQSCGGGGIGQIDDVAVRGLKTLIVGDRMDAVTPGGGGGRGGEPQQHGADQLLGEGARDADALEQTQGMPPGGQADGPAPRARRPAVRGAEAR